MAAFNTDVLHVLKGPKELPVLTMLAKTVLAGRRGVLVS
jgi:hypothetical protein